MRLEQWWPNAHSNKWYSNETENSRGLYTCGWTHPLMGRLECFGLSASEGQNEGQLWRTPPSDLHTWTNHSWWSGAITEADRNLSTSFHWPFHLKHGPVLKRTFLYVSDNIKWKNVFLNAFEDGTVLATWLLLAAKACDSIYLELETLKSCYFLFSRKRKTSVPPLVGEQIYTQCWFFKLSFCHSPCPVITRRQ